MPGVIVGNETDFPLTVTLNGESYKIDANGEIKKVVIADRTGLNVGDYIDYQPDKGTEEEPIIYSKDKLTEAITGDENNTEDITQDTLNWQILKIYEDGSMDVIGSPTTKAIYFKEAEGYNNGVYVMNDICETLYSKKSEGITARSVNLEDFEKNLTTTGEATKDTYISEAVAGISTGTYITNVDTTNNTVTYVTERSLYPNIYSEENGSGIDTSAVKTDGIKNTDTLKDENGNSTYDTNTGANAFKKASTNGLTATHTDYNINIDSNNYGDAYKVLNTGNSYYWVASRSVGCNSYYATFRLHLAGKNIQGESMFFSYIDLSDESFYYSYRLRPVVHLGSEAKIEVCTGENKADNMHTITQY